jgi:sortase A
MPSPLSLETPPSLAAVGGRLVMLVAALAAAAIGTACVACAVAGIRNQPKALPYLAAGAGSVPSYADLSPRARRVVVPAAAPRARVVPPKRVEPLPAPGERFALLTIPALKRTLPVVEGTSASDLEKGVGHFSGSAMPGGGNNCVLSGHRDTVFTGLGAVGIGDDLVVWTSAGKFTYRVRRTRIVHKDDRTVIVPTDHAVLTVTTCYPFHYVGAAPDRFILIADLVSSR